MREKPRRAPQFLGKISGFRAVLPLPAIPERTHRAHRTHFRKNMTEFISQNIVLVALFVASGLMLIWPSIAKMIGGSKEIGTLEATRLMNSGNALVLDIRDTGEFNGGRIPKSKNIPFAEISKRADEIQRFKDKPVIVTCRGNTRAGAAARALKAMGFTDVYQLQGGFTAWQQASLPTEK
jgi:rhodanese-related sulfurtransferase